MKHLLFSTEERSLVHHSGVSLYHSLPWFPFVFHRLTQVILSFIENFTFFAGHQDTTPVEAVLLSGCWCCMSCTTERPADSRDPHLWINRSHWLWENAHPNQCACLKSADTLLPWFYLWFHIWTKFFRETQLRKLPVHLPKVYVISPSLSL